MKDIYEILSRHFAGEADESEAKKVATFKKENKQEYDQLKRLWKSNKIKVLEFDTSRAWQNMLKTQNPTGKRVSLSLFRKIAASIAIVLLGTFAVYIVQTHFANQESIVVFNDGNEKTKKIILDDGTQVWLNRNAKLVYPEKFDGTNRPIELEGEAFFDVTEDKSKPFIIRTKMATIKVLGTTFNVNSFALKTEVAVTTGKVVVESTTLKTNVILNANEAALTTATKNIKSQINNPNYLSWKTGSFMFDNANIQEVVTDLNTFYITPIILDPDLNTECRFTAQFNSMTQNDIIEVLATTCNLIIEMENEHYILTTK